MRGVHGDEAGPPFAGPYNEATRKGYLRAVRRLPVRSVDGGRRWRGCQAMRRQRTGRVIIR